MNDSLTECTICFKIFTNPYILTTCGHSFCYDCITQTKKLNNKITCPICRNVCPQQNIIKNYQLEQICAILGSRDKSRTSDDSLIQSRIRTNDAKPRPVTTLPRNLIFNPTEKKAAGFQVPDFEAPVAPSVKPKPPIIEVEDGN